jgi:hypothetical protein
MKVEEITPFRGFSEWFFDPFEDFGTFPSKWDLSSVPVRLNTYGLGEDFITIDKDDQYPVELNPDNVDKSDKIDTFPSPNNWSVF